MFAVARSPLPLPNPTAFEDKRPVKKQKRLLDPSLSSTSRPCPSTPARYTPAKHCSRESPSFSDKLCFTDIKRRRSSDLFSYGKELGSGSYGVVHRVLSRKDQQHYAIKCSKKPIWNMHHRARYLGEISHAQSLSPHPSITTIYDAWEEGGHIYTQMELCASSLKDVLAEVEPSLSEKVVWQYISDIMRGVQHMHEKNLVHLDIKPDNILVGFDSCLKLTDFGISIKLGSEMEASEGDKIYMAPELLDDIVSPAADIFSVGITLYEVVTGYELPGEGLWWRNLREGLIDFPEDTIISEELQNLIRWMMAPQPTQRPTALEVLGQGQGHLLLLDQPSLSPQHLKPPPNHPDCLEGEREERQEREDRARRRVTSRKLAF